MLRGFSSLFERSQGLSTPKRAQRGIWMGKRIMTGNNVSFSEKKTRRRWLPNVQTHRYYSLILQREIRLDLTTHAMRSIDKYGGIDPFLMYMKKKLISDSHVALALREEMMDEWKKVKGFNWNSSVMRYHQRKKLWDDWEEKCKNVEGEDLPPKPQRRHRFMYDISVLDIHQVQDRIVKETAPEGEVFPHEIQGSSEDQNVDQEELEQKEEQENEQESEQESEQNNLEK